MEKTISLTNAQYRELLLSVIVGTYIREAVAEIEGESSKSVSNMETYLLAHAEQFGAEDMVEDWKGVRIPSEAVCREYHERIIGNYDEDTFWHELETRLGKRDFAESITDEDKRYMKANDGWLPERVHTLYAKYADEFETHGVDRLRIVKA